MRDVTEETREKARHDVEVTEDAHEVAGLDKVMEVTCQFNHFCDVMVRVQLVR